MTRSMRPRSRVERCDPAQPFGPPAPVIGINSDQDEAAARLSADETTIYFSRRATTVWDLWRATRDAADGPFGTPELLTTVNSVSSDVWPSVSEDGLTLYFEADRTTPGTYHIWRSTRASTSVPFGPPQPRPELMDNDVEPLLANAGALYFASSVRGGLGASEILWAPVSETGSIGAPALLVGGVNTAEAEDSPAITADERVLFFRRILMGESDIYMASRSTATDGFGPSSPVPGLAEAGVGEVPTWVSPDGCHLYYHTSAAGGSGGVDVWMAARPPAT